MADDLNLLPMVFKLGVISDEALQTHVFKKDFHAAWMLIKEIGDIDHVVVDDHPGVVGSTVLRDLTSWNFSTGHIWKKAVSFRKKACNTKVSISMQLWQA